MDTWRRRGCEGVEGGGEVTVGRRRWRRVGEGGGEVVIEEERLSIGEVNVGGGVIIGGATLVVEKVKCVEAITGG